MSICVLLLTLIDTLDIEAEPKWQVAMFLLLPYASVPQSDVVIWHYNLPSRTYGMRVGPCGAKICPINLWGYKPLIKVIESISKVHQNPFRSRKRDWKMKQEVHSGMSRWWLCKMLSGCWLSAKVKAAAGHFSSVMNRVRGIHEKYPHYECGRLQE